MSRKAPRQMADLVAPLVKSGISTRVLMPRLTRSAAARKPPDRPGNRAGEQTATAGMVTSAANSEGEEHDAAARLRSTSSISPPRVDSTRAPSTARKRWIGTATETTIWLLVIDPDDAARRRRSAPP